MNKIVLSLSSLIVVIAISRCSPNAASVSKSLLSGGESVGGGPAIGVIIPELLDDSRSSDQTLKASAQLLDPSKYRRIFQILSGENSENKLVTLQRHSDLEANLDEFRKSGKTELRLKLDRAKELSAVFELDLSKTQMDEFGLENFDIELKRLSSSNNSGDDRWVLMSKESPAEESTARVLETLKSITLSVKQTRSKPAAAPVSAPEHYPAVDPDEVPAAE